MFVWTKRVPRAESAAWEEALGTHQGLVITDEPAHDRVKLEVFCGSRGETASIKREHGGSVSVLRNRNWAALQPEIPPPVMVRDRLIVSADPDPESPARLAVRYPQRDVICVPADLAFGTGHHATTATVLRLLVDFARSRKGVKWSLLDLGTGTGVLAIAAEKLGAASAWGCDFDPMAVRVARQNLKRNRTRRVSIEQADVLKWKPGGRHDCVAANLFCDVLEAVFPKLVLSVKRDGVVLVSGILKSQSAACLRAGEKAGLRFSKVITRGKWVTALGVLR